MHLPLCVHLADRALLRVAGVDARAFLQGLISNDIHKVTPNRAIWAAFLTPQGKYLHDFFVYEAGDALLLDTEAARLDDLRRRLSIYKLRSQVSVAAQDPPMAVWALFGTDEGESVAALTGLSHSAGQATDTGDAIMFADPRHAKAGLRAILPRETGAATLVERGFRVGEREDYDRFRIELGLPDGSRDMLVDKSLLLECGFDELHGVDWQKGCYMGQELTARTRYRGLVKRRLVPFAVQGTLPAPGTLLQMAGKAVGEVRSGANGYALALLRIDALEAIIAAGGIALGETRLALRLPDWWTANASSQKS
jgi:tRNA-modifying protein YgfZ